MEKEGELKGLAETASMALCSEKRDFIRKNRHTGGEKMFGKKKKGVEPRDTAVALGAAEDARKRWHAMYLSPHGLRLPAAIAGELARLTTLDMRVSISGGAKGELLETAIGPFLGRLRRELEQGMAEGGMVFKPYYDGKKLYVDAVKGDSFVPISWDAGGVVKEALFYQELKKEDAWYTRVERHVMENGGCRIENSVFKSRVSGERGTPANLDEVEEWADMAESLFIENVDRPLFGLFRTPSINPADPSSPLGASVFAGAEGLIADADRLYKNLLWEFESGKRRLYVDITAFDRDGRGEPKLPDTELFRTIDVNDSGFFSEWSPQLRNEAIQSGLNTVLQRVEFGCGLAYGTISQPSYVEKTAEEVRASKQRSYCFVCDLQAQLKTALEELIAAMDVLAQVYGLASGEEYRCAFEFDDGLVADRQREYEEKVRLVELGAMQPWELRAWYLGEDPETAKEALAQ